MVEYLSPIKGARNDVFRKLSISPLKRIFLGISPEGGEEICFLEVEYTSNLWRTLGDHDAVNKRRW
jgi:hypothetical protein